MALLFIVGIIPFIVHLPLAKFYQWIPMLLLLWVMYGQLYNDDLKHKSTLGGVCKNMLLTFDRYSLSIYIIHHILIFAFLYYFPYGQQYMTIHYVLLPILMFIVVLIGSYCMAYILHYIPGTENIIGTKR